MGGRFPAGPAVRLRAYGSVVVRLRGGTAPGQLDPERYDSGRCDFSRYGSGPGVRLDGGVPGTA